MARDILFLYCSSRLDPLDRLLEDEGVVLAGPFHFEFADGVGGTTLGSPFSLSSTLPAESPLPISSRFGVGSPPTDRPVRPTIVGRSSASMLPEDGILHNSIPPLEPLGPFLFALPGDDDDAFFCKSME